MAMTRAQLRHKAAVDRYKANRKKHPTRREIKAWLDPIRKAMAELRTGEVDSYRGYAITRIHWADDDFARIDHAINGFDALISRLLPDFDLSPFRKISKKLANGILLQISEVDSCVALLRVVEDKLIHFRRTELVDAANTEMINIELERLGIKEAA